MTSKEIVDDLLRCGPQSLNVSLDYIAARMCEARLRDGCRINDVSDAAAFLHECAEQVQLASTGNRGKQPRAQRDYTCPDCHHEHEGRDECQHYLGEGKFCLCESKVRA